MTEEDIKKLAYSMLREMIIEWNKTRKEEMPTLSDAYDRIEEMAKKGQLKISL